MVASGTSGAASVRQSRSMIANFSDSKLLGTMTSTSSRRARSTMVVASAGKPASLVKEAVSGRGKNFFALVLRETVGFRSRTPVTKTSWPPEAAHQSRPFASSSLISNTLAMVSPSLPLQPTLSASRRPKSLAPRCAFSRSFRGPMLV